MRGPTTGTEPLGFSSLKYQRFEPEVLSDVSFRGSNLPDRIPDPSASLRTASSQLVDLTGHITREYEHAVAHGGFADVYKGVLNDVPDRPKVCHRRV
jgi:hypothetical protein